MRFLGEETKGLKNWNLTNLDINLTRPKIKKIIEGAFIKVCVEHSLVYVVAQWAKTK